MELAQNLIYLGLLLSALMIQWGLLKEFSESLLKNLLSYSFAGGIFLGLIRLLFWLAEQHVLSIDEMTVMIGWHLMFYLTMTIFVVAMRTLLQMTDLKGAINRKNPYPVIIVLSILMVAVFPFTVLIDHWSMTVFEGSVADRMGVMHFIAFFFAGLLAVNLGEIKKKFSEGIGVISFPLQLMLAVLSYIHLQELLVESWKVVTIPGNAGEVIESILWVPVFVLFLYAFIALKRVMKKTTNALS